MGQEKAGGDNMKQTTNPEKRHVFPKLYPLKNTTNITLIGFRNTKSYPRIEINVAEHQKRAKDILHAHSKWDRKVPL